MTKKHLLTISCIFLLGVLVFTAYNSPMHIIRPRAAAMVSGGGMGLTGSDGWTFETAIEMATDVVVAEFVGSSRPFEQRVTEYEFIVHDKVFGNAADTIFVYVVYEEASYLFADPAFQFTTGTQYLLPLVRRVNIYSPFHYDGFRFVRDIVLDLNNPSRSTMHNEPLALRSNMNFNSNSLTREQIISYVITLPRDPSYELINRVFITSDNLECIINESPYVLVIEITELVRLTSGMRLTSTDIYLTTVVEVLKGDLQVGDLVEVIFFADTVFLGETHIVSVTPDSGSPYFQVFTSSNSLHSLDQREEIIAILTPPTPTPEPIPDPTPTPDSTPTPVNPTPTTCPTSSNTQNPGDTTQSIYIPSSWQIPPSRRLSSSSTPRENDSSSRFTASLYEPQAAADIELINVQLDLPEDFVTAKQERDNLNTMFLQEQMHSMAVLVDDEVTHNIPTIISVYIGDLNLSNTQMLMLRGFAVNPDTGEYMVIPGHFSTDRNYFNFGFVGAGYIGAMFYELPTPLLRLNIDQYHYYYRGLPQTSDVAPFITQSRTMVPIRLVSEALGATPRWDGASNTAYIYYNEAVLRLPVDQPLPDGMGTPILLNRRVLVPLRLVIESFDAFTFWDGTLREVTVYVLD